MQTIETNIRLNGVHGIIVDSFNMERAQKISLVRGMQAELVLQLFNTDSSEDKVVAADFELITSWICCADVDYNQSTDIKILIPNDKIAVDEDGKIHISILETNTVPLATAMETAESIQLIMELLGFAEGDDIPSFALQFPITIYNRVSMSGAETPAPVVGLNEAIVAKLASMFSPTSVLPTNYTLDDVASLLSNIQTILKGY